jgi:hemoglobin
VNDFLDQFMHQGRDRQVADESRGVYAALGGYPGLRRAVDEFMERVVADPPLAAHFVNADMNALRRHQVDLLAAALGGPQDYTGRNLTIAHAGMNITDAEFDRVVGHLNAALVEVGADDGTIRTVIGAVGATRDQIVGA